MIKKIEIIQNNVFASYTIPTKDIIIPTNPIKFQRRTHENGEYVIMYVVYTKQIYRSNKELNWNENEENEKDEEDDKDEEDEEKNKKILMN